MTGREIGPAVACVVALVLTACGDGGQPVADGPGSADPVRGAELYTANCVACHGAELQGAATGPPLVDELYVPPRLTDEEFATAITRGVPEEHWDFGAMPPVTGLDESDVAAIIAYVREAQAAAGLLD